MKKLERMREEKKRQEGEDRQRVVQSLDLAGQGYVDYELPPDYVSEKDVERSTWHTIKSFIPFSNEYYESMAAEEEMDNLKKIRIERVRAEDLLVMTKMGKHDDALDSMMAETNYDFFYFNKLKMKMELEGKFHFEPPKNNNIFLTLEKGPNKNRLRKAINQAYSALDHRMTDELLRLSAFADGRYEQKKYGNDQPCMWRGKTKSGDALRCDNPRLERPQREVNTMASMMGIQAIPPSSAQSSSTRKKAKEYFAYCCYHVPFCISMNHEIGQNVKIRIPNAQSLCAECFMLQYRKRPANLKAETVPGVVPANFTIGLKDIKEGDRITKSAQFQSTLQRELMKYLRNRHFATPRNEPSKPIQMREYIPLPPPESMVQKMGRIANQVAYKRRYFLYGKKAAIIIQSTYRMYRVRNLHIHLKYEKMINKRWQAAIMIQSMIRRFFQSRYMRLLRDLYHRNAITIQRIYRGYRTRYRLLKERSSRRILAFMKKIYFFKFKDAVIMIMQLRLLFIRRNQMAIRIQRLYRGYTIRCVYFQMRLWKIISTSYAKKIQQWYRYHLQNRHQIVFISPGEEFIYQQITKRLYNYLTILYNNYKTRQEKLICYQQSSQIIQRLIRGYLAKRGVKKLENIRYFLQSYLKPSYAIGFYQQLLVNPSIEQYIFTKFIQPRQRQIQVDYKKTHKYFIRKFLPSSHLQEMSEVHYKIFYQALVAYYQSIQVPLSQTELHAIMKRFRNPLSTTIYIEYCDEFISYHPQPCFKHGRAICGNCIFRRQCTVRGCKCRRCCRDAMKVNVCKTCHHARHLHTIYPLQSKAYFEKVEKEIIQDSSNNDDLDSVHSLISTSHSNANSSQASSLSSSNRNRLYINDSSVNILNIFTTERNADMSLPVGVEGTRIQQVLLPALDYDDIRCHIDRQEGKKEENELFYKSLYSDIFTTNDTQSHNSLQNQNIMLNNKLTQSLAQGKIEGDGIEDNVNYWLQPSISILKPEQSITRMNHLLNDNIHNNALVKKTSHGISNSNNNKKTTTTRRKGHLAQITQLQHSSHNHHNSNSNGSNAKSNGIGGVSGGGSGGSTTNSITTNTNNTVALSLSSSIANTSTTTTTTNHPSENYTVFNKITYAKEKPSNLINYDNFWEIVSKNPNKSIRDYNTNFDANMPMPMVCNDEVVYSIEFPEIYMNILSMIIHLEDHIHYDNPLFLKLVMNHIQVFERHWRNMVIDIRSGKVNHHVMMNPYHHIENKDNLDIYQHMNIPRPQLAEQLDQTFRQLGFHKKVIGKDIHIRAYAEKKSDLEITTIKDNYYWKKEGIDPLFPLENRGSSHQYSDQRKVEERRPSLSFEPNEEAVLSMSRPSSSTALRVKSAVENTRPTTSTEKKKKTTTTTTSAAAVGDGDGGDLIPIHVMYSRPPTREELLPLPSIERPPSKQDKRQLAQTLRDIRDAVLEPVPSYHSNLYSRHGSRGGRDRDRGGKTMSPSSPPIEGKRKADDDKQDEMKVKEEKQQRRRKSHSEAQRGISREEIQEIHYNLLTLPRSVDITDMQLKHHLITISRPSTQSKRNNIASSSIQDDQHLPLSTLTQEMISESNEMNQTNYPTVVKLSKDRYVCPVPGCGKSFLSTQACFRHMKVHEHKPRLAAATPLSDAQLQYYWPRDIPWSSVYHPPQQISIDPDSQLQGEQAVQNMFCQEVLPPGAIRCRYPGCKQIFATLYKMYNHLKLVHNQLHPSHKDWDYYEISQSPYLMIPPELPPCNNFKLPCCRSHTIPTKTCSTCMEVERLTRDGPKPPYKLLQQVDIDLTLKKEYLVTTIEKSSKPKAGRNNKKEIGKHGHQVLSENDRYSFVLCEEEKGQGSNRSFRGRCWYLVFDRMDILWIGLEKLYTQYEVSQLGNAVMINSSDFSSPDELIPQHIAMKRSECTSEDIIFLPVHCLQSVHPVAILTTAQIKHWQKKTEVGDNNNSQGIKEAQYFLRADRL